MAEEVVVKDPLTQEMIAAGRELTKQVEAAGLDLVCSLWLFATETNQWRLVFGTTRVDSDGPLKVYAAIQDILEGQSESAQGIDLQNISVMSPNQPLIKAIRSAFKVEAGFVEIRFTRSRIGDVFVEDSLIYFIK